MNRLFHSATVRLVVWYMLILTVICLMFSTIVYQITINEVHHRLTNYTSQAQELPLASPVDKILNEIRAKEMAQVRANLVIILFYTNLIIIIAGGVGAYFLAKRTLKPVEDMHEQQIQFVSDASHELRTPLATMTTELEAALRDSGLKKDEMRQLLTSNLEEVRRLTKLSNTLLALSVNSADILQKNRFDLIATVNSIVSRINKDKPPIITVKSRFTKLLVVAHQSSIEELITILLDNAIKYNASESDITVAITKSQQKACIKVSNYGPGINEEHLPHIFDRFYRADNSRSGNSGYGLGLALAKQLSDLHQAELSVKSAPNQLTEFWFTLPTKKS